MGWGRSPRRTRASSSRYRWAEWNRAYSLLILPRTPSCCVGKGSRASCGSTVFGMYLRTGPPVSTAARHARRLQREHGRWSVAVDPPKEPQDGLGRRSSRSLRRAGLAHRPGPAHLRLHLLRRPGPRTREAEQTGETTGAAPVVFDRYEGLDRSSWGTARHAPCGSPQSIARWPTGSCPTWSRLQISCASRKIPSGLNCGVDSRPLPVPLRTLSAACGR